MLQRKTVLLSKMKEALSAVLPVTIIIVLISFTVADISSSTFIAFIIGSAMLVIGTGLFSLGTEMSMSPIGEYVGSNMTKSKKLWLIVLLSLFVGTMITVSEPDLQVLAEQVSESISRYILIIAVGIGVGIFLVLAMLRIIIGIRLNLILIISYAVVFTLLFFVPDNFRPLAFDSGGVTTGPMTVPFIMALGVGVSSIRSDNRAESDSFGLVALCSVGPILAVMILGIIFSPEDIAWSQGTVAAEKTVSIGKLFLEKIPSTMSEVLIALGPIVIFFLIYQLCVSPLTARKILKITIGVGYTYIGLVLFLTGVNVGFLPAGYELGCAIGSLGDFSWIIVPFGALIGYYAVKAEPAVQVLEKQVEDVTSGAIPKRALAQSLAAGVAASVAISMLRALTGISVLWFLIPGYALAIILSFFVPNMFTAIAFDSGGVASGPLTAAFLLPLSAGVCTASGGSLMTDAFGVVALVAMTPLITIQTLGIIYSYKLKINKKAAEAQIISDDDVIDL